MIDDWISFTCWEKRDLSGTMIECQGVLCKRNGIEEYIYPSSGIQTGSETTGNTTMTYYTVILMTDKNATYSLCVW